MQQASDMGKTQLVQTERAQAMKIQQAEARIETGVRQHSTEIEEVQRIRKAEAVLGQRLSHTSRKRSVTRVMP